MRSLPHSKYDFKILLALHEWRACYGKLDNKTLALDSALALPRAFKISLAQYFPRRLIDDLDIVQFRQSTTCR